MKKTNLFAAILLAPALAFADDNMAGADQKKTDDKADKHEQVERSMKKGKEHAKEQKAMRSKDGKENWHNMHQGKSEMKAGGDAKETSKTHDDNVYGDTGGRQTAPAGSTTTQDTGTTRNTGSGMATTGTTPNTANAGTPDGQKK